MHKCPPKTLHFLDQFNHLQAHFHTEPEGQIQPPVGHFRSGSHRSVYGSSSGLVRTASDISYEELWSRTEHFNPNLTGFQCGAAETISDWLLLCWEVIFSNLMSLVFFFTLYLDGLDLGSVRTFALNSTLETRCFPFLL